MTETPNELVARMRDKSWCRMAPSGQLGADDAPIDAADWITAAVAREAALRDALAEITNCVDISEADAVARAALAEWIAANPTRKCSRISVTHDAGNVKIEMNWTEGEECEC